MNRLNDIARRCSAPFARDAELQTEIENEVNDHLACAAAEVGEEEAAKRFGDPEPVAQELLLSNFNRLKWRSRFKLAVKILIVPAVLAAVFFCVDRDVISGNLLFFNTTTYRWISGTHEERLQLLNASLSVTGRPPLTEEQYRILINLPAPLDELKTALDKKPDPINRVRYIMALIEDKNVKAAVVEKELSAAIAAEPDNALYDLLFCSWLSTQARTWDVNNRVTVRDRRLIDRAMDHYLSGIRKPYLRTYAATIYAPGIFMSAYDGTLTGWALGKVKGGYRWLPHISHLSQAADAASDYAALLIQENDPRAGEFINGWKRQSLLMGESDDPTLEMQLFAKIVGMRASELVDVLRKHGDENAAMELTSQLKASGDYPIYDRGYAGSAFGTKKIGNNDGDWIDDLLAAVDSNVGREEHELGRRLLMVMADGVSLVIMELLLVIMMVLLAFDFLTDHRGAYIMLLHGKSYLKLLLFGVLIPLIMWQLWSYAWSMGSMSAIRSGIMSALFLPFYLAWFTVLAVITLRRRYIRLNAAKITRPLLVGNLIVLLAGFVLANSLIMGLYFGWEKHRTMADSPRIFAVSHLLAAEEDAVADLRTARIKILEKLINQPIKLEQTGK